MEEKLRESACFGDLDAVLALLRGGADINGQHRINGWTALHWAAKRNNLRCVEILLANGADKMVYTSKGELPAHLTTNKNVLQALGYSGQQGKESRDFQRRGRAGSVGSEKFMPNYLRNPPLNYKVDTSSLDRPPSRNAVTPTATTRSASATPTPGNITPLHTQQALSQQISHLTTQINMKTAAAMNANSESLPVNPHPLPQGQGQGQSNLLILKVRLVGREEYDRDYIEIDFNRSKLTFRKLIDSVCEEFSIDPKLIIKIRKMPNTKLRRDVEVQRLEDYTELEIETVA